MNQTSIKDANLSKLYVMGHSLLALMLLIITWVGVYYGMYKGESFRSFLEGIGVIGIWESIGIIFKLYQINKSCKGAI